MKAVGEDVKEYYEAQPTFKRGDIVTANITISNETYKLDPCLTERKLYAVLDEQQKATGKYVRVIDDKGREKWVRNGCFSRTTNKLN